MPYTDILRVDGRFQSSINIQYDIGDLHKIDCYIPTDQSVQVLKEYLNAIYYGNKNEYATVLVGPYGKGKSHLMLVLLSLLAAGTLYKDEKKKRECVSSLERLITRIERIDPDTAALARETLKQKKPLLPVIVDSNATEINQVLILALRNALERCGCEDLLPEMNFDVAIKMIDRWEKEYPDAFERLKNELLPHKYSVADMKDALGTYSKSAYDIFVEIYPAVTSGSIFAPIFAEGALQLYKSVNNALIKQTEFGGMFVVYDEFTSDETDIISRIALLMEGISIEDWNDQGAEVFCERLKKALEGVAEANAEDNRNAETGFSITISRQNESIERTVEEKEISAIGKTLMNNLRYSIDEYGEAISSDEKVAILIEMIKEVMGEA